MNIQASPSGKYKLTILKAEPRNSVGQVFLGDKLIDTINRNYSSFPYCWIEGHKNGHDYLICGEDYQGQTVIELDSGKRKDALSPHADQGYGFCWAEYRYSLEHQIIIIGGCIWAAPYEYRFFDFSDPMSGWSEITCDEILYDDDETWPEIQGDGTIIHKEMRTFYHDMENLTGEYKELAVITTLKRNGDKLELLHQWRSDMELKRIADYEVWVAPFIQKTKIIT